MLQRNLLKEPETKAEIDFGKLKAVLDLCRYCAVGFDLVYEESCNQWYFVVSSSAANENFIGKSTTFDIAVNDVLQWLRQIAP